MSTPSSRPAGVEVRLLGLRRVYGTVHALAGLTLEVSPGEFVSLLGPSGCGKTTALRILAGLETADDGQVRVGGRDITELPANRRDMGMVFQAYSLFPNMTALENVGFGLRIRDVSGRERRRRAAEMLELVGLTSFAKRYPHQLSGGQQQRVALARALAIRPQVLLLDEPLSALDAKVRVQLREEIRRIQTELATTTLFVTHDQEEALAISDRVGVMSQGRLEQLDTPAAVYNRPATPFVAEFVGVSNALTGRVEGPAAVLDAGRLPASAVAGLPAGSTVRLLVRPNDVRIRRLAEEGMPPAGLAGTVLTHSFLGPVTRVGVRLDGSAPDLLRVDLPSAEALGYPPGHRVALEVDPAAPMVAGSSS